jgi:glucokinase
MAEKLAGHISGSRVQLAQVSEKKGETQLVGFEQYISRNFSDFDAILKLYMRKSQISVDKAVFGVAGPVIRNQVTTTHLPWHLSGEAIAKKFSFEQVKLVNDVVATAHGLDQLDSDKFFTINEGVSVADGNVGLVAAGTGLGEVLIYSDGRKLYPYASEGGHADFAPGNQLEAELWQYLYSELGQVEVEDVVSLSGLERIYNFLIDTREGTRAKWFKTADDRPAAILEKALSGSDETAGRTLDIFIDCYASEAANLALKGMTLGGVYISGQIAPRIITALDKGRFMERFIKKGKLEAMLAKMPVGIIIEEKTPLLGAAGMALAM